MSIFRTNVRTVPVADVKPYPKNAKIHPRDQIEGLKEQIRAHGFDVLIVVDADLVVIKGHGRLQAVRELDAEGLVPDHAVPVIVRDDLTDEQVRAARLADNLLAESPWNRELQALEVKELVSLGVKVELVGLSLGEFRGLTEPPTPKKGATEIGEGDFQKFEHQCPRCGFEYDGVKGKKQ